MIQNGTKVKIVDNTGARTGICLKVQPGYKARYAFGGDIILLSIKTLRSKRRESIKVKKGELYKALVLRVKTPRRLFSGDFIHYTESPSVVLLTKQKKILGTRIFGSLLKRFRYTKYLKALTLSSGTHEF